jgi:glycosyltransferase involved in cell wall biosynthesis
MGKSSHRKIVCLTNIFDQNYHDLRGERVERQLTTPFRRDLFHCLQTASGWEVILLSSPPKAAERRKNRWLPPVETKFFTHRQLFCANWDVPKLRIPLSWIFYARHVLRHTCSGDLVVMDNYEIIYVIAARILSWFRCVKFLLVYLDGKHLIDHGWNRFLSGLAEIWGRPLFSAACLSVPTLGERLPKTLPKELVPGFLPNELRTGVAAPDREVRFLYTGLLAHSHGIDLLLESLEHMPECGWHLTIAGQGPLTDQVIRLTENPRWQGKVSYLRPVPPEVFKKLLSASHVGLNCLRSSDPISTVTFPSKVFTYLSAGLLVISSRASNVPAICGQACHYYDTETALALAQTIRRVMTDYAELTGQLVNTEALRRFTTNQMTHRLRELLLAANMLSD